MRKFFCILFIVLSPFVSGCTGLFFYPQRDFADNPIAQSFSPQDVYFKTADGLTLHGWYVPASKQGDCPSILVLHGNAQNLSTHINSVLWLTREGFNIFIFDYRGYGRSEGSPDIKGVHRDAEAAFETLLSLQKVKEQKVIVLGQSIGGAIAVYTVANSPYKDRIAALVIDSAFSGYRLIAREKLSQLFLTWPFQYPLSWTVTDNFSAIRWIQKVSPVPPLILHGIDDPIVPTHHGRELYEAALQPKELWLTTRPGHVQSFDDPMVRSSVVQFLNNKLGKDSKSAVN